MEELGEGGDEKPRRGDKERANTTSAARRRHRGHPVAVDAAGKRDRLQLSRLTLARDKFFSRNVVLPLVERQSRDTRFRKRFTFRMLLLT